MLSAAAGPVRWACSATNTYKDKSSQAPALDNGGASKHQRSNSRPSAPRLALAEARHIEPRGRDRRRAARARGRRQPLLHPARARRRRRRPRPGARLAGLVEPALEARAGERVRAVLGGARGAAQDGRARGRERRLQRRGHRRKRGLQEVKLHGQLQRAA